MSAVDRAPETALNRICPYFTMFPLRFPHRILLERAEESDRVCDPFCGRGTTNYAARLLGLDSVGIDSSPVAAAVSQAKLVAANSASVTRALESALDTITRPNEVPEGEFWERAFHPSTLRALCRVREALLRDCRSQSRIALRAIVLGALHGPQGKAARSYFSNQSPRTFAPKPDYAVRFWRSHRMQPHQVNVRILVKERAKRFFDLESSTPIGRILLADSRQASTLPGGKRFQWVITSPPYYGMRTYVPDQWLRNWFVGGPSAPDYSNDGHLKHSGADTFAADLRRVWIAVGRRSKPDANLVVRFGGIRDRAADPVEVIKESLKGSGWGLVTIRSAGLAPSGRRQAQHFGPVVDAPRSEFDVWAVREA